MPVRRPIVAGMFYPAGKADCLAEVKQCLKSAAPPALDRPVLGSIAPHAGWTYSGPTAARVFAALHVAPPETIVLFGAVHSWGVARASLYASGSWQTPLGDVPIDEPLAQEVLRLSGGRAEDQPRAHASEHSIEVQLPFVAHLFPTARILPIAVPPASEAVEMGRWAARAVRAVGRRAAAVGSSDLTHYGPRYGLAPVGIGPHGLAWAKQNDARLLDLVVQMRAADVVPEAEAHHNACGAGAIAAAIAYAAELGATQGTLLHYTTSHDVMPLGQPTDLVGYGAVIFT